MPIIVTYFGTSSHYICTWGQNSETMGLLDFLLGDDSSSNNGRDHDRSVFDTDRFRNNGSGNWVDWEDVSTGRYEGDGFEHPNFDEDGEW